MAGAHFINLEETIEVNEKLQESEEEEQDFNDKEELKRKLQWAETSYRQERELHDHMSEHGLTVHRLINETAAENKYLTGKMKEYQQQMANIRKMWEGEDEEALRQELLSKDESIIKSQLIYMREMEKVNQRLREKNEDLTVKLDALFKISLRYQEDIQTLGTAEQEYKHKLEEVHGVLCSKDDEIEKDLRQKQRELQEELSSRQQEHIL
ncbi:interaptin-like isoform X1 [Lates japonicus]|uniref:Interaptin-like isoform X1 n=1 Tax=Lates japonicus TaxID=270547 RepID=A0AAD3M440_LATJO|nr:interaptin-like isoform X1 [Lates japonicus]